MIDCLGLRDTPVGLATSSECSWSCNDVPQQVAFQDSLARSDNLRVREFRVSPKLKYVQFDFD